MHMPSPVQNFRPCQSLQRTWQRIWDERNNPSPSGVSNITYLNRRLCLARVDGHVTHSSDVSSNPNAEIQKLSTRRCLCPNSLPTTVSPSLLHSKPASLLHLAFLPYSRYCMADQSRSSRFRELFESALQAYEKKAGVILAEHPLVIQLHSCNTVESISAVLQDQANSFGESQGSNRLMRSVKNTVSTLNRLSGIAFLAMDIGLVVRQQPFMTCSTNLTLFKAIYTCESNPRLSCYPSRCTSRSPVHM
jgi:hypothetical protein